MRDLSHDVAMSDGHSAAWFVLCFERDCAAPEFDGVMVECFFGVVMAQTTNFEVGSVQVMFNDTLDIGLHQLSVFENFSGFID